MLETAILHMLRRRKAALALLFLAMPYGFAGTVSTFLHHHQDPGSLYDPQCPSCNFQKLVQDVNTDAEAAHLLPRPEQSRHDLVQPACPIVVESSFSLIDSIRAPPL